MNKLTSAVSNKSTERTADATTRAIFVARSNEMMPECGVRSIGLNIRLHCAHGSVDTVSAATAICVMIKVRYMVGTCSFCVALSLPTCTYIHASCEAMQPATAPSSLRDHSIMCSRGPFAFSSSFQYF